MATTGVISKPEFTKQVKAILRKRKDVNEQVTKLEALMLSTLNSLGYGEGVQLIMAHVLQTKSSGGVSS